MLTVAYSQSNALKELLSKIDAQRAQLMTTSIPPKTEIRLRWEALIARIFWTLSLEDQSLTKADVAKLISAQTAGVPKKEKFTPEQLAALYLKDGYDWIKREWHSQPDLISPKAVLTIHTLITHQRSSPDEAGIKRFLDYLQTQQEHPVIQAGIACIQVDQGKPFPSGNLRASHLVSYLFLSKHYYDMRDMLVIPDYFKRTKVEYEEIAASAAKSENVTRWLEYFATAVSAGITKVQQDIAANRFKTELPPSFWELNDRQKAILTLLDQPGSSFTNRQAQKLFNVSQITASRDLAKLATLGLIFPHGKGRSVYYSKV